jgi:hypothetical protein
MELNKCAKDPNQRDEWRRFTLQNNLSEKKCYVYSCLRGHDRTHPCGPNEQSMVASSAPPAAIIITIYIKFLYFYKIY